MYPQVRVRLTAQNLGAALLSIQWGTRMIAAILFLGSRAVEVEMGLSS